MAGLTKLYLLMKWLMLIGSAISLTACFFPNTGVVEYTPQAPKVVTIVPAAVIPRDAVVAYRYPNGPIRYPTTSIDYY